MSKHAIAAYVLGVFLAAVLGGVIAGAFNHYLDGLDEDAYTGDVTMDQGPLQQGV
jgi:hypothetical protein